MEYFEIMEEFLYHLRTFVTPTVSVFGDLGSILCLLVLFRIKQSSSKCTCVIALTVSYLLYLLVYQLNWIALHALKRRLSSNAEFCQLSTFLEDSSSFLVNWFMTLLCVERLMFYWSPAVYSTTCSNVRALVAVFCIALVCVVLNVNFAVTKGVVEDYPGYPSCVIMQTHPLVKPLMKMAAETIITNLFPCVIIPFSLVACLLLRLSRHRSENNYIVKDNFGSAFSVITVTYILLYFPLSTHRLSVVYRAVTVEDYAGITNQNELFAIAVWNNLSRMSLSLLLPTLLLWKPFRAQFVRLFRRCEVRSTSRHNIEECVEMKEEENACMKTENQDDQEGENE